MRKLLLAALLALAVGSATAAEVTILSAHRIHTMDTNQPQAQAMAYDASGKILALGDAATLAQRYPGAQRLDVGVGARVGLEPVDQHDVLDGAQPGSGEQQLRGGQQQHGDGDVG